MVKRKFLIQNKKKQIDLDNPVNYEFLQSKGADFSVFGIVDSGTKALKKQELKQKPVEKPLKQSKTEQKSIKKETQEQEEPPDINSKNHMRRLELDSQLKIENIKSKQKETEYKTLKIREMQRELIPRKIVDQLIGDFFGRFNEMLLNKPKGIVGDIKAEVKDGTDQTLIRLLQKTYMRENEKLLQNAKKRYIDGIDEQIKELEDESEN
jgi:hypothetical protein